ncbi:MAG: OmpA family protein, partial [Bacteroidota bacterium]
SLAVKQYLVKKGLPENRIESRGFGSTQPVADNKTDAGRAQNRRVQIALGQ